MALAHWADRSTHLPGETQLRCPRARPAAREAEKAKRVPLPLCLFLRRPLLVPALPAAAPTTLAVPSLKTLSSSPRWQHQIAGFLLRLPRATWKQTRGPRVGRRRRRWLDERTSDECSGALYPSSTNNVGRKWRRVAATGRKKMMRTRRRRQQRSQDTTATTNTNSWRISSTRRKTEPATNNSTQWNMQKRRWSQFLQHGTHPKHRITFRRLRSSPLAVDPSLDLSGDAENRFLTPCSASGAGAAPASSSTARSAAASPASVFAAVSARHAVAQPDFLAPRRARQERRSRQRAEAAGILPGAGGAVRSGATGGR